MGSAAVDPCVWGAHGLSSAWVGGHQPLDLAGVVAAACERGTNHLEEPQLGFPHRAEIFELFWCHKAIDWQMLWAWR